MSRFVSRRQVGTYPRLPLKGSLDLTYRCNNDCRHCWLRVPRDSPGAAKEMTRAEIGRLAAEARALGCREWTISGGEPMLRPDFPEIFEDITSRAATYTLITNGTLITPEIARMLKRPGAKLISLYGATAAVHDHVTRRPGSFEDLERGVALLREAGAGFTVQIVPLRDNFHQYGDMVRLAESWGPDWRIGAAWLHLSASRDRKKNIEIMAQRLSPEEIDSIDPLAVSDPGDPADAAGGCAAAGGSGLYAECLAARREFHVDPYGMMSFCALVKDPALRVDVRASGFGRSWEEGLPAMAERIKAGPDYRRQCGTCELRPNCRWCPVFAYLEHGDHSARVDDLCRAAAEAGRAKRAWFEDHRRYYRIGGLTIRVEADLPFAGSTFRPKFEDFRVDGPGPDMISIRHHFELPDISGRDLGEIVYQTPPWEIHRKGGGWIYRGIFPGPGDERTHRLIAFAGDHTKARVFNPSPELFLRGDLDSLMLLPSDQILLARALPGFGGLFIHAAGVDLRGNGLLFAGPSEAGKSTIVKMLAGPARILCDDRTIVRRSGSGFEVHGSWSHGEVATVSPGRAPLRAVFFLRQADENRLVPVAGRSKAVRDFLPRVVRPLVTADWWEAVLELVAELTKAVPFYDLYFDRSGAIVERLEEIVR